MFQAVQDIRHFLNDFELILILEAQVLPHKHCLLGRLVYGSEGVVLLHVYDGVSAIFYHYLLYFLYLFHINIITTHSPPLLAEN